MMHGQVNSLRKCLFPLAGAAVVLLGCQQEPRSTAAGGFEPSPVDLQDEGSMSGPRDAPGEPDSLTAEPGEGEADEDLSGAGSGATD
jgi:hypothetical protein